MVVRGGGGGAAERKFFRLKYFEAELSPKRYWRWPRFQEKKGGRRRLLYLTLRCQQQNEFCVKMASDESRFNVCLFLTVRGTVTRLCP